MEFSDPKGIYLQIADRIRDRILRGEWSVDEQIPSVREMAVELGVNPNTVARSYQALVTRNIIINQRGRGFFVREGASARVLDEMRKEFLLEELPRIAHTMRLLDLKPEEIVAQLTCCEDT